MMSSSSLRYLLTRPATAIRHNLRLMSSFEPNETDLVVKRLDGDCQGIVLVGFNRPKVSLILSGP